MCFKNSTKDFKCLELRAEYDRKSGPRVVVIGQGECVLCARGRVWDCRQPDACTILDYDQEIRTNFDLEYLAEKFERYPDQRLASNVLEADIELQIVLQPNVASVGLGYDSVQRTVRELHDLRFYDFFTCLPFVPINVVGPGSRRKKICADKYRRTSDFSGPHRPYRDGEGHATAAINEASKQKLRPTWMSASDRPELHQWETVQYSQVRWKNAGSKEAPVGYKFPKEFKPNLVDVMTDVTILLGALLELGEQIIVMVADAAYYFNQFAYVPEELWKSNLATGARLGDEDEHGAAYDLYEPILI